MPLNTSGPISLAGSTTGQSIAVELGLSPTGQISLNQTDVRTLAGIATGAITMPTNFYGKGGFANTQRGFLSNQGTQTAPTNQTNLVSNTGVIAAAIAGVGSYKALSAGCTYGGDKGITAFGQIQGFSPYFANFSNLVSNTGVQAADVALVGSQKTSYAGCSYGGDKGMIAFGRNTSGTNINLINNVSNVGILGGDISTVAYPTAEHAGATYGGDKGFFALGRPTGYTGFSNLINLVSNTGVVGSSIVTVAQRRRNPFAVPFGGDKGYLLGGQTSSGNTPRVSTANIVSNTGTVSSDIATGLVGRSSQMGCGFGGDKGLVAYGVGPGATTQNIIENTGVIGATTTCNGPSRGNIPVGSCGYSFT
jgi:hypothetical protein